MFYVKARIQQEQRALSFRIYVTDALQGAPQGKYLTRRWTELVEELERPVDRRSGEEIAADFIRRAGLHFKGEE
ncbi:MAG: hypothetical protein IKD93_02535 [Firmicutes bacterium]|nr:hypothetical protein [Bacillota bacterium]